ncbi:MAG: inorganic phosphate transporter, partial [Candidatus Firestonebacteria bacterium]
MEIYFLIILIVLSLSFDFLNGFHDSANIVATMISSRAMSVRAALLLASVAEFVGPFLVGIAVAKTIGAGIVDPSAINIGVIIAAVSAAVAWNLITWAFGVPSSSSHALIGGLVGAVAVSFGVSKINSGGVLKVLIVLFTSPVVGFVCGYLFNKFIIALVSRATPRINTVFKRAQIFSSILLAISHGGNDAQKTMGIITMGLVMFHYQSNLNTIPLWVMASCAGALALGISFGGFKIMKTMGFKIFRMRPMHGFSIQVTSSLVILTAALVGGPVSTTHVVSSSVFGVGASEHMNRVRWSVVWEILKAWVITLPVSALFGAGIYKLIA